MSNAVTLQGRDFNLVIDSSGSMATADQRGGLTRWQAAEESTIAIAGKISKYDPDGFTLYTFSSNHRRFDNVSDSQKAAQIFQEVDPNGSTNLDGVLKALFDDYKTRKTSGKLKPAGEITVVITDGQPDDGNAVKKLITDFTHALEKDEDYGILFVQVGNDPGAKHFLKSLDDDLKSAKFDIVDTITMDEAAGKTLAEVLAGAISD